MCREETNRSGSSIAGQAFPAETALAPRSPSTVWSHACLASVGVGIVSDLDPILLKCAAYQLTRLWLLNCGGLALRVECVCGRGCVAPWVGWAGRWTLVPSRQSSAISADEYSSGEAAGEKTEQNDDDNSKSQEVSEDSFHTCAHLLKD